MRLGRELIGCAIEMPQGKPKRYGLKSWSHERNENLTNHVRCRCAAIRDPFFRRFAWRHAARPEPFSYPDPICEPV